MSKLHKVALCLLGLGGVSCLTFLISVPFLAKIYPQPPMWCLVWLGVTGAVSIVAVILAILGFIFD